MASWLWPCPGNTRITSRVGPRDNRDHNGLDIAAPEGSSIIASRAGTVTRAEFSNSYGNVVYISHGDGYETRYAHMVELPMVKKGQRVTAGQQIGKVGNTGNSRGNHLHFEIRYNDIVKDPEDFVSPSNTIINPGQNLTDRGYPSSTSGTVANNYDTSGNYSSTPGGVANTYGDILSSVRTKDFIEGRPFHAYLRIFIGEKELTYDQGKPSIIQSFEVNRLEGAGDRASFTLFDTNWDDIEVTLAENWNNISIQYGYSEGISSPRYKMLLQDYSLDFVNTGVILHIQAISEGIYKNLNPITFDTQTKNPGLAIKRIINHIGFNVDLSDFIETEDVDRQEDYKVVNMNPITYIYTYIMPEARGLSYDTSGNLTDRGYPSSSGNSGNNSIVNRDTENIVFLLDEENKAHLRAKTYGRDEDSLKTYVYMKGYDSVVEDLSFQIKGVFGGTTQFHTVTDLRSGIFDVDKSERAVSSNLDSSLNASPGEYTSTLSDQSTGYYVSAGETQDQMTAILNYHIKNGASQAYEANMVILGDPTIQMLQEVRILNITDSGHLHHTSGRYLVTGISDSIQNGNYKTTLVLRRNGDISNGIKLRKPKVLRR